MASIELIMALGLLGSVCGPNFKAIMDTTIRELARLYQIEVRATQICRSMINDDVLQINLAEQVLKLAEEA